MSPWPTTKTWDSSQDLDTAIGRSYRSAAHAGSQSTEAAPTLLGTPNAQVSIEVVSLDEAIADLAAKGHEPIEEITDTGYNRFTTYSDPDGNLIQVIE